MARGTPLTLVLRGPKCLIGMPLVIEDRTSSMGTVHTEVWDLRGPSRACFGLHRVLQPWGRWGHRLNMSMAEEGGTLQDAVILTRKAMAGITIAHGQGPRPDQLPAPSDLHSATDMELNALRRDGKTGRGGNQDRHHNGRVYCGSRENHSD